MERKRTRLGIEAENMGRPARDPGIVAMARAIEEAGADSVSVSDHLLSISPGSAAQGAAPDATWLEALACLAAISGVTSRARLVTSVIILPQRNVLELLKTATTIDHLSGGRLLLGVGAGWNEREMAALGYDFAARGRRMDEMLQVIRGVREGAVPPLRGAQLTVPEGIVMAPARPLPLYIGGAGVSNVSLRRAVAYGDGWMPYSPVGRYDLAALGRALQQIREERSRLGREPLDTIFKLSVAGHADPALERAAAELAALGFDEIIVQGVFDAGIAPGIDAIGRLRRALDA